MCSTSTECLPLPWKIYSIVWPKSWFYAAVHAEYAEAPRNGKLYTEDDWNMTSNVANGMAYHYSKVSFVTMRTFWDRFATFFCRLCTAEGEKIFVWYGSNPKFTQHVQILVPLSIWLLTAKSVCINHTKRKGRKWRGCNVWASSSTYDAISTPILIITYLRWAIIISFLQRLAEEWTWNAAKKEQIDMVAICPNFGLCSLLLSRF